MKQYPLLKNTGAKAVFSLFLLAMLFLSRDTLFSSCRMGFAESQIGMFALILVLGLVFLWVHRRSIPEILRDRRMVWMLASALILVLPMLVKQDWQLMYFSILLCVLTAVFLTYFTSCREVAKYYVVILTVLGLYSLIATYGLKYLARGEIINPPMFRNASQWRFFDFGFAYVVRSGHWHRNFGIFREPGVYQFFVMLAIYLNNYEVDWDKHWKLWLCNGLLVVTMISTFAMGGYAELGLFAVFLFIDKKWYREKWGKLLILVAFLAVAAVVGCFFYYMNSPAFVHTIFYEFYDMFIRLTTDSASMVDRKDAILTNIGFFVQNPLVGDTIGKVLHGTNHNTSSTMLLYAILGVVGGTMNVVAWIALLWKRERRVLGNLVLLAILFLSFNTQNLVANVFFWLFPMMALVERGRLMLKKE